jgi:hypothetical protein
VAWRGDGWGNSAACRLLQPAQSDSEAEIRVFFQQFSVEIHLMNELNCRHQVEIVDF